MEQVTRSLQATYAGSMALGLPIDRTVIGVFSGSLGSRRINEAVRAAEIYNLDKRGLVLEIAEELETATRR